MDGIRETPLTFNGSDPHFFRRVDAGNKANIIVLIILILFVKFLMIIGLYSIRKKNKTRRDGQVLSTILDDSHDMQQHRQRTLLEMSSDVQAQG